MGIEILLIQASTLMTRDHNIQEKYNYPPIGLISIAGVLSMHGYKVQVIDLFHDHTVAKNKFAEKINELAKDPFLIGIETYTPTIFESLKIAKFIKNIFPKAKIVLGGAHVTFEYEEVLCHDFIDYVVRNEGEATIIELLEHLKYPNNFPADRILGLVYKENRKIKVNPRRKFLTDLDTFPLPSFEFVPNSAKTNRNSFVVMSSRGCPGNCTFCSSRAMSGGKYRFHSAKWLISHVYYNYHKYRFASLSIMDDTFLVDKKRVIQFWKYMNECKIRVPWSCKSRVDVIDEDIIKVLSENRCISVHIGIESGDENVLKSINKGISINMIFQTLKILRKFQIRPECSFIMGHHTDTLETIEKTVLLAKTIRDNGIGFSIIGISTPFPGTPLNNYKEKYNLKFVGGNWNRYDLNTPIYFTDNFSVGDLKKAQYYFDVESKHAPKKEFIFSGKDLTLYKHKLKSFVDEIKNYQDN